MSFYHSPEWKALRLTALRRDGFQCVIAGCGARAVVVDHIKQREAGGADALPNLRSLCQRHHNMRPRLFAGRVAGCDADGWPITPDPKAASQPRRIVGKRAI
ncbi:MAG: HNH endonuclease [Roseomonas sp.]|nr:HNH endonuclease [Roseomonas sp.]